MARSAQVGNRMPINDSLKRFWGWFGVDTSWQADHFGGALTPCSRGRWPPFGNPKPNAKRQSWSK